MMRFRSAAIVILILSFIAGAPFAQAYRDSGLSVDVRVKDLLSRMTPEEKFWQLFMLAGGLDDGVEKYSYGAFGFQISGLNDRIGTAALVSRIQRHFVEKTRLG